MNQAIMRVVVWLLTLSAADAGGIYFTDRGASQLRRMNFDGTGLQTISLSGAVMSPGSNIRGLAVDTANDRLFWADNGENRLLRANFDGSSSVILHTITGGSPFPADVRLDLANSHFYWCDQMRNRIQRSALDGTAVTDVITSAAPTGPYYMELDSAAGKIYWGDFAGGSIYRSNLDATARETLVTGLDMTRGLGLDLAEGMIYFVSRDDKTIHRCPLAALGNGSIPVTHPAVQTLYTGLDTPHGLELDIPARKLYWADTGSSAGIGVGDRAVSRGDFDGSGEIEILATGSEPWDVALDRRCANYIDWTRRCFRLSPLPVIPPPDDDPDRDEMNHALEYAFDTPPFHAGTSAAPKVFLTTGPMHRFSLPWHDLPPPNRHDRSGLLSPGLDRHGELAGRGKHRRPPADHGNRRHSPRRRHGRSHGPHDVSHRRPRSTFHPAARGAEAVTSISRSSMLVLEAKRCP